MERSNDEYHSWLVSSYFFNKNLYSLSFTDRVLMDLECLNIQFRSYSKELDKLSNKEIEDRLKALKAPWWNNFYKKNLHKNKKILYVIFILIIRKDLSWRSIRQLYKIMDCKEFC